MNRLPISWVPRIFCWAFAFAVLFGISTTAYADVPVLYVQVPQWTDDWAVCAVDIPDSQCQWYVQQAANTFGEGVDWENAPWFDVNGLNDIPPIKTESVVQQLQHIK